ncbi:rRNA maturation RNase YbeY [Nonlabens sp. Hel1_33_55]|uniref:rRNA maturation RNase YbeY n=1 Tax=Nonlabens sp. Hel1_33_55 TaxID=1336802 RepID=UPI000875CAC7|nr:rRNA maturation RNase YbeY [Nonlabens sp. Hel1_33_55]SCY33294.1 rRNA maturation RNase YbeY [Nonlabens sp. Hel1_33_55]
MIEFSFQTEFDLDNEVVYVDWLSRLADHYDATIDSLGYVFCDDDYVHSINLKHLDHDTYTDIITFDYGTDSVLEGEIYISIDRVKENAADLDQDFQVELRRVMSHGLLHMMGFGDQTDEEKQIMRGLEDQSLEMFHVKQ